MDEGDFDEALYVYFMTRYFNQLYLNLHLMTTCSLQAKMNFCPISKYQ